MLIKVKRMCVLINGKEFFYDNAEFEITNNTLAIKGRIDENEYVSVYFLDKIERYSYEISKK